MRAKEAVRSSVTLETRQSGRIGATRTPGSGHQFLRNVELLQTRGSSWHRSCPVLRMYQYDYEHEPVKIPKNNFRALLALLGALLVLAALVFIFVGFVDAGTVAPDETKAPAPPAGAPRTGPR